MNKVEILAPVGGEEQLMAAVRAGADAIYMGAKSFNARQNATNFTDDALLEAVSYCHARNVKVHVTLNTLIFDDEIGKLKEEVRTVAKSGADAVIVQDLLTAKIVRECSDIPMHASTQMAIHNIDGVKMAEKLGFTRAVLARELSLEEIKIITDNANIEIETFVHGALCTCLSGACYLSAMFGGRSGNRGLCAQPCRLDFKNPYGRGYALSLKDMSYIENVSSLVDAGVTSFKIEGRMKRPEYVAAAVTALKDALDGKSPDMKTLKDVFSRGGFTDGYLKNKRDVSMYGYRTKDDVDAMSGVLGELAGLYRNERQSVPVDMELLLRNGRSSELSVSDGLNYISVEGEKPETAVNAPITEEYVTKLMSKTGGTPFVTEKVTLKADDGIMLPSGKLNAMRREALEKLLKQREEVLPKKYEDKEFDICEHQKSTETKIRLRFENAEQIPDNCNAEYIILPLDEVIKNKELTKKYNLIAEIPPVLWGNDAEKVREKLSGLDVDVMCSNIGAVEIASGLGKRMHGDFTLNVTNSVSLSEYERLGLSDATLSFELGMPKIKQMKSSLPRGIIGYGYLPLMKLRMCPGKGEKGCGNCNGRPLLTDRNGVKFQLICRNRKYTELLNSVPLYIGDKNYGGVDFVTLYFTTEDKKTVAKVINAFTKAVPYEEKHTNGLYYREVK